MRNGLDPHNSLEPTRTAQEAPVALVGDLADLSETLIVPSQSRPNRLKASRRSSLQAITEAAVSGLLLQLGHTVETAPDHNGLRVRPDPGNPRLGSGLVAGDVTTRVVRQHHRGNGALAHWLPMHLNRDSLPPQSGSKPPPTT